MSEEPFAQRDEGPLFARAQNLIHEHLKPGIDPDFEWSEPTPSSEREPGREPRFKLPDRVERAEAEAPAMPEVEEETRAEIRILRAVPDEGPVAALIADSDSHRKEVASRVSHLFPPPETTEWSIAEAGPRRTRPERD
jgi:hypothetical protein